MGEWGGRVLLLAVAGVVVTVEMEIMLLVIVSSSGRCSSG